jgi:formylmethanofuran dehydrogenase subunit E-like metal-binding protein
LAQSKVSYAKLIKMAEAYGVADNALFLSAANQYTLQQRVIENIKKALDEEDSLVLTKEYVKNRANAYANPLVRELPKHSDSANKTLNAMLDIITKLGHEPKEEKKQDTLLEKLMSDMEDDYK